jgi:sodium transport system permease protein
VGKWGAVLAVALLIAVLSCLSFLPAQKLLRSESLAALFRFGFAEAAAFVALLAPLAAALSATMMAIAIRCKTFKEAQAGNSVVVLTVSLLPMIGLFGQEGEAAWHRWVPGLSQTTLMTRVLKGSPIGVPDALPGVLVCLAIVAAALLAVDRQLVRRAAQ